MPSTISRLRNWLTDQQQVATLVAVLVALAAGYAFEARFGVYAGSFLLLMLLGVGVPSAYEERWPRYDHAWQAVAWVLVACGLVVVAFVGSFLAGRALALDSSLASVGAFLAVSLGGLLLLRGRRE
ncbi:hypothetical protein [Haloglomus litoreum]|uniref:hypothetical protein n=1 Tax=Haloglomus litoreum TaxID=3034026 RepID=UPI0023E77CDD|nr:hypothetical protein [Haloglomus sp. DT116]